MGTELVDIVEAVVGTAFLAPVVFAAIVLCGLDADPVLAVAAVLVLPIGWLAFTFERYVFTFRGRYEHYPALELIRNLITVSKTQPNEYKVDLKGAIPKNNELGNGQLTLTQEDFDILFDPYKPLKKSRILSWKSYRMRQQESKERFPSVENIEDMTFFDNPALSDFIRGAIANYHTYLATAYSFLMGIAFSVCLTLTIRPERLFQIPSMVAGFFPEETRLMQIVGLILCGVIFIALFYTAIKQSRIRRNEAIAHEYLYMKLRLANTLESKKA